MPGGTRDGVRRKKQKEKKREIKEKVKKKGREEGKNINFFSFCPFSLFLPPFVLHGRRRTPGRVELETEEGGKNKGKKKGGVKEKNRKK